MRGSAPAPSPLTPGLRSQAFTLGEQQAGEKGGGIPSPECQEEETIPAAVIKDRVGQSHGLDPTFPAGYQAMLRTVGKPQAGQGLLEATRPYLPLSASRATRPAV